MRLKCFYIEQCTNPGQHQIFVHTDGRKISMFSEGNTSKVLQQKLETRCPQDIDALTTACKMKASLSHKLNKIVAGKVQSCIHNYRAPDKVHIFISKTSIFLPNPMFDHLLESSHRDDSNKWSSIGIGQEIKESALIEIYFTHLIWRSES